MIGDETPNFSQGRAMLGALVSRTRKDSSVQKRAARWLQQAGLVERSPDTITQKQFADWVSAMSGVPVSESAIGRLERSEGRIGPPTSVLIALCHRMKLLKLPDGSYCDMDRAVDILCGEVELDEEWLKVG